MAEMVIENGVVVKGIDEPHVVIPEGVIGIGFDAFARSKQLVTVQFPQTLTHIEEFAFIMCSALEELDLPDGITALPMAFESCSALKRVRLPQHLQRIESFAFCNCPQLAEITLPESLLTAYGTPFDRETAILIPTQAAGMIRIAPRRTYPNCYRDELSLVLRILHQPERYGTKYPELTVFEYKAAAAVSLLRQRDSETAEAFVRRNFKRIAEDYINAGDVHMTELLLDTGCWSPAQRKAAAKTAQAAGQTRICALLNGE